ncbi:MAG TPA: hypothetical protein VHI93_01210, partial [Candidatus Thermoplasmatota archaeon]|nr:hypothetical protein [Candidatus Thermoplasmatota archaeon]
AATSSMAAPPPETSVPLSAADRASLEEDLAAVGLEVDASGWTKREIDLTSAAGRNITLWFQYRSSGPLSETRNNLGWFIDDIALTSVQVDPATGRRTDPKVLLSDDLEGLAQDAKGAAGAWAPVRNPPGNDASPRWSLVGQGAPATRPTGWNVQAVEIPGQGPVAAWRFSDAAGVQGYPKAEESRLVTPTVDLTKVGGTGARLQFDHRYGFESVLRCPAEPCGTSPAAYRAAIDGGAVEYQVYDPSTARFGPWQQLGARFREFPDTLLLQGNPADRLRGDSAARLAATGYSAVMEHGDRQERYKLSSSASVPFARTPIGLGFAFEAWPGRSEEAVWPFQEPWHEFPVSYVFSGVSGGAEGWNHVDWDISPLLGKRVRFGFHVASNPSLGNDPTLADAPAAQRGWSIANVAVRGEIFDGKPAQIRLRLATDGSSTKGEWSVDNIRMVGERYTRNAAVLADTPTNILTTPGTQVTLQGRVANLGTAPRSDLALGVLATDLETKQEVASILQVEADPPVQPVSGLPAGLPSALGPFSLQPGDSPAGRPVPFRVLAEAAAAGQRIGVRVVLLERHG